MNFVIRDLTAGPSVGYPVGLTPGMSVGRWLICPVGRWLICPVGRWLICPVGFIESLDCDKISSYSPPFKEINIKKVMSLVIDQEQKSRQKL
jgi:hypothetical protein